MSRSERNEELWRLAVEIEGKESQPASERDCSEVQEMRKRFKDMLHQKSQEAEAFEKGD